MKPLIQKLVETQGPSGYETQIRSVVRGEVEEQVFQRGRVAFDFRAGGDLLEMRQRLAQEACRLAVGHVLVKKAVEQPQDVKGAPFARLAPLQRDHAAVELVARKGA